MHHCQSDKRRGQHSLMESCPIAKEEGSQSDRELKTENRMEVRTDCVGWSAMSPEGRAESSFEMLVVLPNLNGVNRHLTDRLGFDGRTKG